MSLLLEKNDYLVVAAFSVLVDVKTFLLDARLNTQTVQFLDAIEEDETACSSPEVDDEDAEALSGEESPTATIEGAVARREQTCQQGTEDTANTVYRRSTYRVVNVKLVVDELNGEHQHDTTNETNDNSTNRRNEVATSGDTHETCQDTVEGE